MMAAVAAGRRVALDKLVAQMMDPGFVTRYRRMPSMREVSGHASAAVLAVASPRSRYVRRWRRHARSCTLCGSAFRYFGLRVD